MSHGLSVEGGETKEHFTVDKYGHLPYLLNHEDEAMDIAERELFSAYFVEIPKARALKVHNAGWDAPIFTLKEVSEISAVSMETIRTNIKRGHVTLAYTRPEGHGVPTLYAMDDVVAIIATSELALLGIAPKAFGDIPVYIKHFTLCQIQFAAGVFGEPETTTDNDKRYVVVYYDKESRTIKASFEDNPITAMAHQAHIARIVIDCRMIASRIIDAFFFYGK